MRSEEVRVVTEIYYRLLLKFSRRYLLIDPPYFIQLFVIVYSLTLAHCSLKNYTELLLLMKILFIKYKRHSV